MPTYLIKTFNFKMFLETEIIYYFSWQEHCTTRPIHISGVSSWLRRVLYFLQTYYGWRYQHKDTVRKGMRDWVKKMRKWWRKKNRRQSKNCTKRLMTLRHHEILSIKRFANVGRSILDHLVTSIPYYENLIFAWWACTAIQLYPTDVYSVSISFSDQSI